MARQENRNDEGEFQASHKKTSEDVFETMEPLEPYTTRELADELDIPRRTVYKYLEELHEDGQIRKKKPEPRQVIWLRGA